MTPWHVIERLYDSEINAGLQSDWDGGISVWIGGPVDTPGNSRLISRTFMRKEFADISPWLDDEARRLFPESDYARNRAEAEDLMLATAGPASRRHYATPGHASKP
jgi:hypothetical protein